MKSINLIFVLLILTIAVTSCDKTTVTTACKGNPGVCMNVDSFDAQLKRRLAELGQGASKRRAGPKSDASANP